MEGTQDLLYALCKQNTNLDTKQLTQCYKYAVDVVNCNFPMGKQLNEIIVAERIKKHLVVSGRQQDLIRFVSLNNRLMALPFPENKARILQLLFSLAGSGEATGKLSSNLAHTYHGLLSSTPMPSSVVSAITAANFASGSLSTIHSSNIHRSDRSAKPSQQPFTAQSHHSSMPHHYYRHSKQVGNFNVLSKADLIHEIIYVLQGIDSRHIQFSALENRFVMDIKFTGLSCAQKVAVEKLCRLGSIYRKILKHLELRKKNSGRGHVAESFDFSIHEEMTEYLRLIAVLDGQFNQFPTEQTESSTCAATGWCRLKVTLMQPTIRMQYISSMIDVSQAKLGGEFATAIYKFFPHGDPAINAVVHSILRQTCRPIMRTALNWIYNGQLDDKFQEFFVGEEVFVQEDQMWFKKYYLRDEMIPQFITKSQANRILKTGKSINFLRHVCKVNPNVHLLDCVQKVRCEQVEAMFEQDETNSFELMVDVVYKQTSGYLLTHLRETANLLEHLMALRRYLLLGRGDFFLHLMDLISEELNRPAGQVFIHRLTGILEEVFQTTNPNDQEADVSQRLYIQLLKPSPSETGWDIFCLVYRIDGPLRMLFGDGVESLYMQVFLFLWRSKRMEYSLHRIWKNKRSCTNIMRKLPGLGKIFHQCHLITNKMVQFINQVQYYVNYKVIEYSLEEFLVKVQQATDLDDVITAHKEFLKEIVQRCQLDCEFAHSLLNQLRAIFDIILQFQHIQEDVFDKANQEICCRDQYWHMKKCIDVTEECRRKEFFVGLVPEAQSQLRLLDDSYEMTMKTLKKKCPEIFLFIEI